MVRNTIIVAVVVIVLVIVAAALFLFPQAQIIIGRVAIPTVVLIAIWKIIKAVFPERAKLFIASVLRKFGFLPLELKRVVVRNEVEGNLNRAVKEFGCEGKRLLPHPATLVWTSPSEVSQDSFFRDGRIIVRLDYSENPHRNVVEAALLYCRSGLVPETRRYLWSEFRHALDIVFVQAVLEQNNLREGLLYFKQNVLEREISTDSDVKKDYDTLHGLHEHGYFTRIILPELRDYAGRVHTADTEAQHRQRIGDFVGFAVEATGEHPAGAKRVLDHIREKFRVSIIIVGEPMRLASQGQKPYLWRIAKCASQGARTVFLIGSNETIVDIAKNAKKIEIADSSECESYHITLHGRVYPAWCARLEISEQTAASAISRVQSRENWPDFKPPLL